VPVKVPLPVEVPVADITHYFPKIMVCVLKMTGPLSVGDIVRIKGKGTDFIQKVDSLQVESVNVPAARKGQWVGLKLVKPCRVGDRACLLKGRPC